jgi:peroxiredoxin
LREHYDKITAAGADVVAVGTGDERYASVFVAEEAIPYPVLVDDQGEAANAASVRKVSFPKLLFDPRSMSGAMRAHRAGYRVRKSGKRVTQLGATFVIGPGPVLRYQHVDEHTADHAPLDEVVATVTA